MKERNSGLLLIITVIIVCTVFLLAGQVKVLAGDLLTLPEVVELMLKQNTAIRSNRLELKNAETELEVAWRNLFPKLKLQSSYTRLDQGPQIPQYSFDPFKYEFQITYEEGSPDVYNTSLTLEQPLFMGGRALLGIDLAELGLEKAKISVEKKTGEMLFQAIQGYYHVLLTGKMVEICRDSVELLEEHERILRANYENGMALKSDLLKVKIEREKAEQNLISARNKLKMARKQLARLINLQEEDIRLSMPELEPELELDLDKLINEALQNRAELKELDINRDMLETQLKIENRSWWPNLFLMGTYSWQDDEFSFEDGSWQVTLSANMQLYDGGISARKTEGLENRIKQLDLTREDLLSLIKLELEQALLKAEENKAAISFAELSLQHAREGFRMARERYRAGAGTNMEVLNARLTLEQAEISLMQSRCDYQLSLFELLHKTGILVDYCREVLIHEK